MAQGAALAEAIRGIEVSVVTYHRWRTSRGGAREAWSGGLKLDEMKRLKALEQKNTRRRRAVSDLTLDKLILTEAAKGNAWTAPGVQA